MTPDILFSQDDADSVYNELARLCVELDNDPLAFGPKRLNSKVADVRRMLDRCERLFLDISQRAHRTRRALRMAETELDLAKKDLFTNDPMTRSGRSVADRDAIATGKLEKQVRNVRDLDTSAIDLDAVLTVVKAKRTDLKDAESRLRDQIRLCQEEIGLGSRWGSRVPDASDLPNRPTGVNLTELADIDTLIGRMDGEIHMSREAGSWRDPVAPSDVESVETPGVVYLDPEPSVTEPEEVLPVVHVDDPQDILGDHVGEVPPELGYALPSSVSAIDADAFLDSVPLDTSTLRKNPNKPVAIDETLLDDLLVGFESLG